MSAFFADLLNHAHPILNHFPIALLTISWVLDQVARWNLNLRFTAWVMLLLGAISALPAVISGIIAHFPYEESAAIGAIQTHEQLGLATLFIFAALTIWRGRSMRRGSDVGGTWLYTVLGLVGVGVLLFTGYNGGNLVYKLGVGVQGMTP